MIDQALFRSRGFAPSVALNLVASFGMLGSAFFTTQYLQSVLDKSAMEAALWALLPSVPIGMAAPLATALVQKGVNRAYVVTAGFAIGACGYALLALAGTDSLWLVLTACGVLASGIVMVISQIMDLAMSSAPVERAGSASALMETGAEFGGALGMAVLGSIGTAVYRHDIPGLGPGRGPRDPGRRAGGRRPTPRAHGRRPGDGGPGGVHERNAGGGDRRDGTPGGGGDAGGAGAPGDQRQGVARHTKSRTD